MSRRAPPTAALGRGPGGTKAAAPQDASGLFHTLQGHVDDIRSLIQCGICIRPLYEPFTLACGHTFCYGCLTSWFAEGRSNKTCPDCRAPVKSQPAPAYLVRAVVQLFTSRAELLDKGETTDQHRAHQIEEAGRLDVDKKNTDPRQGGLFRGIFNKGRHQPAQPIIDLEDGVIRCPQCSWELDDMGCVNCGYNPDEDSMSGTDWRSDSEENSEMTDDPYEEGDDDIEDGFGEAPDFDWTEWYDGMSLEALPAQFRYIPPYDRNGHGTMPGIFRGHSHDHSDFGSHDSVHDEDEEEVDEDEEDDDMDSFIDDEEPSETYASDSDRSTVVGHPECNTTEFHTIFDESVGSGYSTASTPPANTYDFNGVPDSEEDENEDDDVDTLDNADDYDDEDDDEEPIRPNIAGNRRPMPTYHILSSSSPLRVNGATAINTANFHARPRAQPPPAGSSANRAIAVDDDSDEGPVGPTRRARDRGNCRPSAL
ncbi:hypothetical protein BDW62DRAFT_142659 [Aspergillus aurantiobrunneus]